MNAGAYRPGVMFLLESSHYRGVVCFKASRSIKRPALSSIVGLGWVCAPEVKRYINANGGDMLHSQYHE